MPDTTLPTVVSTSPAVGATGVAVNSALSITFSEAMNPATLTPAAIRLVTADSTISGTISYSSLTAVFTPSSPLAFSSSYTLVVSTAVKDLAGNPLAVAYSCTFITAAPSPPPAGPAPPAPVAVSGDGLVVVSWGAVSGVTSYNVYIASRPGVTKDNYYILPNGARQSVYNQLTCTFSPLINGTTYYFVVTANDPVSGTEGVESVEVNAIPQMGATGPYTGDATKVTDTSAHLEGRFINPTGMTTSVWFEYGPTTAYGSATAPEDGYAVTGQIDVSVDLSGLIERTAFHYRLVTQNSAGLFVGQDRIVNTYATPQVLLNNLDAPVGLVSDGTFLYWQEIYANRVRRLHKGSGSIELIASALFEGNSGNITMDQTHVYWSDWKTIWRAELNGTNLITFYTFSANVPSGISFIRIHSSGLYVVHDQSISRISLDGSTTTLLFERTQLDSEGFGGDVVLDANTIYWSDYFKGTIQKMPVMGGPVITLAVGLDYPDGLLLDGNTLFVSVSGHIKKLTTSGGALSEVAAIGGSMAKDGANMYVAAGKTLAKVELATGETTTLVVGQDATGTPVVDSSHIYWLNQGNHFYPPMGSLNRISKP